MTDVRKCDGPDCEESAKLNGEMRAMYEQGPGNYVIVERNSATREEFHFHNYDCLRKWTLENVKK